MREIRRAILAYWYATVEDGEASALEARRVISAVNVLDEAVFAAGVGQPYRDHRARDPLGKVVMGLELIRNCEEHAPVAFDELLVTYAQFSVPMAQGGTRMRTVYQWANYADMPTDYVNQTSSATPNQKRARKESQGAYRAWVQGRLVLDTFFDAVRFFQDLDPDLVVGQPPNLEWAFAEGEATFAAGDSNDARQDVVPVIYQPLGLDHYETFLPDVVCRPFERRSAGWAAWDKAATDRKSGLVRQAKDRPPPETAREVRHVLIDTGKVIGYGGYVDEASGGRSTWVERVRQISNDLGNGYVYYVDVNGTAVPLRRHGNQGIAAVDPAGHDVLLELAVAAEAHLTAEWLIFLEANADLYLQTRAPKS
jgi:hypothetical protein